MPRVGEIRKLSSRTNVVDCDSLVVDYLTQAGHNHSTLNKLEVWVLYGRVFEPKSPFDFKARFCTRPICVAGSRQALIKKALSKVIK